MPYYVRQNHSQLYLPRRRAFKRRFFWLTLLGFRVVLIKGVSGHKCSSSLTAINDAVKPLNAAVKPLIDITNNPQLIIHDDQLIALFTLTL